MRDDELDESLLDDEEPEEEDRVLIDVDLFGEDEEGMDEPEPLPEGVTVLRLDKFTTTVDRKPKVKAMFSAAASLENLQCFFRSKDELVRLSEPDRTIPRPETEIFGRIISYQDTSSDPEMKVVIEFDMTEVILERLSIISFTEPTLVWMWEAHRQTEIPE